ncbi:MAG: carboxylesterase family protein [Steroidobacteraceae bacterium]|nr:carboxylesterase family protein [Steroidobacteraceae bacterium]
MSVSRPLALLSGWLAAIPLAAAAGRAAPPPDAPVVRTALGEARGLRRADGSLAWYHLPYAAPPVGERRWRPPAPASAWRGVRDARQPGVGCMQDARNGSLPTAAGVSEDCLYLNVFTRDARPAARRPVMVWIHGGFFRVGSGADPAFDGAALTREGVVLVTINYRLDRFGRFAHPALSAAQRDEPLGNYALMDQVAALRWVRQNIARFGGDPRNVTIFGCSAGGVSVDFLMAAPEARGLFQRAIAQSGSIVPEGERRLREPTARFPSSLEQDGLEVARHFGIAEDARTAERLRALTPAQLLSYPQKDSSMNPVVDGRLVPEDPARAFAAGRQAPVPFMSGATSWEASLIRPFQLPFPAVLVGMPRADVEAAYGIADEQQLKEAYFGDSVFFVSAWWLAGQMGRVGQPGFLYRYAYVDEAQRGRNPGAYHCSDTPRTFGTEWRGEPASPRDRETGDLLRRYWTQFAKAGDPNAPGLPPWPRHEVDAPAVLEIGESVAARRNPDPERMALQRRRFATP